jgi:hypothetical protein
MGLFAVGVGRLRRYASLPRGAGALLVGRGADRIFNFAVMEAGLSVVPSDDVLSAFQYDPMNGLESGGDVFRVVGPAQPTGAA